MSRRPADITGSAIASVQNACMTQMMRASERVTNAWQTLTGGLHSKSFIAVGPALDKTLATTYHKAAAVFAGIKYHTHQVPIVLYSLSIGARCKDELLTEAAWSRVVVLRLACHCVEPREGLHHLHCRAEAP